VIPPLRDAAADLLGWVRGYGRREKLFSRGDRLLVAVSGGPDSVALLHLLCRLAPELDLVLGVAHFHHGLRGEEAEEEARFTASLAASLSLPFHPGEGDTRELARRERISLQMAARRLRLQFLRDTCRQLFYNKLALGHTADDQVELFFLRLLRGAGPEGLRGMTPTTPEGLVRPLLGVGKEVVLAWLRREHLPFRQDSSNLKGDYLRNRVRLDLLPRLLEYNPRVQEAVWRAQTLLYEEEGLLAPLVAEAWKKAGEDLGPGFCRVLLPKFLELPGALQKLTLRLAAQKISGDYPLSAAQVEGLWDLARAGKSGGRVSLGDCRVARAGAELHFFSRLPVPPRERGTLPSAPGLFEAGGWTWRLSHPDRSSDKSPFLLSPLPPGGERVRVRGGTEQTYTNAYTPPETIRPPAPNIVRLDRDLVSFPLEIRHFHPGDRFWPQGAPGSKKLKDFLGDRKIPRWLRPYLPLALSRGEIVWVGGLRIAETVKVTGATRNLLEIELIPGNLGSRRIWEMLGALRAG
jgi:tRNA(Ile)-lysidine synthase